MFTSFPSFSSLFPRILIFPLFSIDGILHILHFSMGVCGAWYLSECTEITCCESYRFRLYILLFSVLCVLAALLVGATWLLLEFRPSYRNRIRRTDSEQARIEMKSFEETRYLRRFSELNAKEVDGI
ncbi:hypothetical protein ANCCAN_04610 [Ancylostoma caninum]|uniref:Uncharacterized protein n=1 Tax=Ancylostoma caninum TaxID=29170 RepID=A0A368H170_ANCCA|nr:hypothetical protein ANCCAN_04610 [Ancylostoma caninum]